MSDEKFHGEVIFFSNKLGYGFCFWEKNGVRQKDLFIHYSNIVANEGEYKTLRKNDKIIFGIGVNNRGEPKAIDVEVVKL